MNIPVQQSTTNSVSAAYIDLNTIASGIYIFKELYKFVLKNSNKSKNDKNENFAKTSIDPKVFKARFLIFSVLFSLSFISSLVLLFFDLQVAILLALLSISFSLSICISAFLFIADIIINLSPE